MKIRYPAVEGSFYPSGAEEIDRMLSLFDSSAEVEKGERPSMIISPHAGLVYSGRTAAYAYKYAGFHKYRSAVIFAPSHRLAFYGMSGSSHDEYKFTGGNFTINRELTDRLMKKNGLVYVDGAHLYEHSAEVQLPFIRKYIDAASIAVFVYGEIDFEKVSYTISDILDEGEDLVIISTDLSHFHDYEKCRETDSTVIRGIEQLDTKMIQKGEACGMTGILAAADCAKTRGLKPRILDYRNSGDITGDRSGVVGYMSAAFV